jgi:hypothetical protein
MSPLPTLTLSPSPLSPQPPMRLLRSVIATAVFTVAPSVANVVVALPLRPPRRPLLSPSCNGHCRHALAVAVAPSYPSSLRPCRCALYCCHRCINHCPHLCCVAVVPSIDFAIMPSIAVVAVASLSRFPLFLLPRRPSPSLQHKTVHRPHSLIAHPSQMLGPTIMMSPPPPPLLLTTRAHKPLTL